MRWKFWEQKTRPQAVPQRHATVLEQHVAALSQAVPIALDQAFRFAIIQRVLLPPKYNRKSTDLLIEIPRDYPLSPPGVGEYRVFVAPNLMFQGRRLRDLHPNTTPRFQTPGYGPWAWLCYEHITWEPHRDDLIHLLEMIRADLTNPPTEQES